MVERGDYQYVELQTPRDCFLEDVLAGLAATPKTLQPKYFYDARGSELFEAICALPEYYLTRTELAMLDEVADELATLAGTSIAIVEFGSGSGVKTAKLIGALHPEAYVAIDISRAQLRSAIAELAQAFPLVRMTAICADYTQPLPLPLGGEAGQRRILYFPGSTIGNLSVDEARAFLANARALARAGGAMLVGVDLKKAPAVLNAAYNDAAGVTAQFNLNILSRINSELGADFDLEKFEHHAFYDEGRGRVEMHLVSLCAQRVRIGSHAFAFASGETIHTENSYKYSLDEFQHLARDAGFEPCRHWVDRDALFSMHYLVADR